MPMETRTTDLMSAANHFRWLTLKGDVETVDLIVTMILSQWWGKRKAGGMKVVLFCGGLGLRMRDVDERIPKPMVTLGNRPILWHVMKYYAHFGHTDFILCLGHKAEVIKSYFLQYDETV